MKRNAAIVVLACILVLLTGFTAVSGIEVERMYGGLIRFHVRANSDSDEDQQLKRQVRDAILVKFSPLLEGSNSLEETREIVRQNLKPMEEEAARVITASGKNYSVKADLGYADFPVKSYGSLTLPAGRYEAVQVIIGEGKGANWWCVMFPPLCFVDITSTLEHGATTTAAANPKNVAGKALEVKAVELKPIVKFKAWEKLKRLFFAVKQEKTRSL